MAQNLLTAFSISLTWGSLRGEKLCGAGEVSGTARSVICLPCEKVKTLLQYDCCISPTLPVEYPQQLLQSLYWSCGWTQDEGLSLSQVYLEKTQSSINRKISQKQHHCGPGNKIEKLKVKHSLSLSQAPLTCTEVVIKDHKASYVAEHWETYIGNSQQS